MSNYRYWLSKEYGQWINALNESTVHNFKDHPIVKRMLGDFDGSLYSDLVSADHLIESIDRVGYSNPETISGAGLRMLYYAKQILLKRFSSIVEIGAGAGEFYAILRALGYTGDYMIMDLPEVMEFQKKYLLEIEKTVDIRLPLVPLDRYDVCISFFALGEFDDEAKDYYIKQVFPKCDHGFILWNPHSGASQEIPFPCRVRPQRPLEHPDCKQLEW